MGTHTRRLKSDIGAAAGHRRQRGRWARLLGLCALVTLPAMAGDWDGSAHAQGKGPVRATAAEPPVSLTGSDGAGLEMTSLSAQVVIEDPLAFTELTLVFRNPEPRVREGRFRITLPSGAVISRFAMKVGDHLQEGEVVELQAARRAYEDFLHRRQDPALLETEAGNEFSARVFPIPPNGSKQLIVSYSQELTRSDQPYRLPLRGLPRLGSLAIRAQVARIDAGTAGAASNLGGTRGQTEVVTVDRHDEVPDRDFEVKLPATRRLGLRHENLVVARVRPLDTGLPADPIDSLTVLVDSSASRALGWNDQVTQLGEVIAALRAGADASDPALTVVAFDQRVEPLYKGRAGGFGATALAQLRGRKALGASDLGQALAWLGGHRARGGGRGQARVLLMTDGIATAGETGNGKLRDLVRALGTGDGGFARLDVLAVGGIRDDERLSTLVTGGLARAGVVLSAGSSPAEIARRLRSAARSGLEVHVPGAAWVWPQRIDGVQPGDEVLIYADLPADKTFKISVAERLLTTPGALVTAPRPMLERAWVKARMARLQALRDRASSGVNPDRDLADALQKQVIDLSIKHRVLCPETALLVLETEDDYRRFAIERRALADILTVGPAGIEVIQRRNVLINQIAHESLAAGNEESGVTDTESATVGAAPTRRLRMAPAKAAAPRAPSAAEFSKRANHRRADLTEGFDDKADLDLAPATAAAGGVPPAAAPTTTAEHLNPLVARPQGIAMPMPAPAEPRRMPGAVPVNEAAAAVEPDAIAPSVPPYEGTLAAIMDLLGRGLRKEAMGKASAWQASNPGDVLALVGLGEAAEALGDVALAARSYGSLIDLFPGRADLRRFAGNRLERLASKEALALAIDTYRAAVLQRPDHPAGHRLLAFALVKAGRMAEAFEVLAAGATRNYPEGRFAGVERILREDLGLIAAAWIHGEPSRASEIRARLAKLGATAEEAPSLRFVLTWETDANDVDFHIRDGRGGHAYYAQRTLSSGGELYADVTTGYGPECFTIRGSAAGRALPYKLQAHYYRRGPMGYGMGKLQVIEHDGRGGLRFEERPFVMMRDNAFVDLGTVGVRVAAVPASPKLLAR
jgi:tetratricopeptide (TPR) repeat protein